MRRRGTATAFGAATVLNAVANWKGSAFGVDLKTSAEVLLDGPEAVLVGPAVIVARGRIELSS